ncbi:MAG TPA: glycosyltransferase family 1 protein [Longimicrobiales bacterium]
MRIGVNGRFYAAPVTGVQRFARELCDRLFGRLDVTLFLPHGAPPPDDRPDGLRVVAGRLAGHAWEQLELPWRARADGCDVILHPANTAPIWGGPHLMVVHDVLALTHPQWFARRFAWWYRFALGRAARRAAAVVTVSQWAAAEITRVLAIPAERVHVVPQGVEPFDRPAPITTVRRLRQRLGLRGPYLLTAGGIQTRKNLGFLLDLLDRWRVRVGDPPLLAVVGEAGRYARPSTMLLPEPDNLEVRFLGHVDDAQLHALYTGAAAFCFPSLAEGFGRPPLEAMACGTPTLVAAYGPAAEVLGDGALILPLDVDTWIDALVGLLAGGQARERLIERGRRVAARYRWEPAATAIADLCHTAAAAAARRG